MSAAARVGDTVVTGHGCDSVSAIAGPGAPTVLINGTPAARVGDLTVPHTVGVPPFCVAHTSPILGASSVLISGQPAAKVGDSVCSGTITGGSPNVVVA